MAAVSHLLKLADGHKWQSRASRWLSLTCHLNGLIRNQINVWLQTGLDNMRDPGILDPRHFFFPRHFYTIYAIFTRFLRDFCDFYAILSNFYAIFAICMRFLRDFCDFYAIFCQAQNV